MIARGAVFMVLAACGGEDPRPHAALEKFIREQMSAGGFPGLAAARIANGEVTWTGTFGYADVEAKRAVDQHTPFLVASLSKTVTAALLMQLVEEGRIDPDGAIDQTLQATARHPDHPDKAVTPRMLATHTSGIVDDWVYLAGVTSGRDPSTPLASFARGYLTAEHFAHQPGSEHDYSNSGFGVLGAVVEEIAGEKFNVLSKRKIFEPLGMSDSGWMLSEMELDKVAVPYSGNFREGFVRGEHQSFEFYPATSWKASISDLSRFLISFMRFGEGLLSEETGRAMRQLQVAELDDDQAFTWYREQIGGRTYLGHSGSALGASALMFFREDDGVGFIVVVNSDAFIRARLGFREGRDALYAIAERVVEEL